MESTVKMQTMRRDRELAESTRPEAVETDDVSLAPSGDSRGAGPGRRGARALLVYLSYADEMVKAELQTIVDVKAEKFAKDKERLRARRQCIGDFCYSSFALGVRPRKCSGLSGIESDGETTFPDASAEFVNVRPLKAKLKVICGPMMDMVGVEAFLIAYTWGERSAVLAGVYETMESALEGLSAAVLCLVQDMLDSLYAKGLHADEGVVETTARLWVTTNAAGRKSETPS